MLAGSLRSVTRVIRLPVGPFRSTMRNSTLETGAPGPAHPPRAIAVIRIAPRSAVLLLHTPFSSARFSLAVDLDHVRDNPADQVQRRVVVRKMDGPFVAARVPRQLRSELRMLPWRGVEAEVLLPGGIMDDVAVPDERRHPVFQGLFQVRRGLPNEGPNSLHYGTSGIR